MCPIVSISFFFQNLSCHIILIALSVVLWNKPNTKHEQNPTKRLKINQQNGQKLTQPKKNSETQSHIGNDSNLSGSQQAHTH